MATKLKYLDPSGNTVYEFTAASPTKLLAMRSNSMDLIMKNLQEDIENGINDANKTTVTVRVQLAP